MTPFCYATPDLCIISLQSTLNMNEFFKVVQFFFLKKKFLEVEILALT